MYNIDSIHNMIDNKSILNFTVEETLLRRIEDFRFKNRFATRAAAVKWLLDWSLKQKPVGTRLGLEPEEEGTSEPPQQSPKVHLTQSEPMRVPSRESIVQALRDQGYEVGEAARHPDGQERIPVRSQDRSAWVGLGQELQELAAARVTLAELAARRAAGS